MSHSLHAQERGPLLMKQELGYTLAGGVGGAGVGILIWFMDPLNPNITLRDNVKDGLIVGTLVGSLFGAYLLQNALIYPFNPGGIQGGGLNNLLGFEGSGVPKRTNYVNSSSPQEKSGLMFQYDYKF